jgi:hypothetical protein
VKLHQWIRISISMAALALAACGPGAPSDDEIFSSPAAVTTAEAKTLFGARAKPGGGFSARDALINLETKVGRQFAVHRQFYGGDVAQPHADVKWAQDRGTIPLVSIHTPGQWAAVAKGDFDSTLRAQAIGLRDTGKTVWLIFHHEPEDDITGAVNCNELTGCGNNGTPAEFVAAWRHFVDIYREVGAKNVKFVWTLMAWSFRNGEAPKYDPGSSYYDFVGADGYNFFTCNGSNWVSFAEIYKGARDHAIKTSRPLIAPEWGSREDSNQPGRKATWIEEAQKTIESWPEMKAVLWYHSDGGWCPVWVDSSDSSLKAFSAMGQAPHFNPTVDQPPAVPSGVAAVAGEGSVVLTWNANTEPDFSHYTLRYKLSSSVGAWSYLYQLTDTRYTVTGLTNGAGYDFELRSFDVAGNKSEFSATVSATPQDLPPAVPSGVAPVAGEASVLLTWNANTEPDFSHYTLRYKLSSSADAWIYIYQLTGTGYTVTGLANGAGYDFQLRGFDVAGNKSEFSTTVSATPQDVAPAVPVGLVAAPSSTQVSLDWADNTEPDLSYYVVRYKVSTSTSWVYVQNVTVSSYKVSGLVNGKSYDFEVRAIDSAGNKSAFSGTVSATPL